MVNNKNDTLIKVTVIAVIIFNTLIGIMDCHPSN